MSDTLTRQQLDDLRRLAGKPVTLETITHAERWSLTFPDAALYEQPEDVLDLAPGDLVAVRGFGAWRHGRVLKIGRSRVVVGFVTPSSPDRLRKPAVSLAELRAPYAAHAATVEHVR